MTRSQSLAGKMFLSNYIATSLGLNTEALADVTHLCGAPVTSTSDSYQFAKFSDGNQVRVIDSRSPHTHPTGPILSYGGTLVNGVLTEHRSSTEPYDANASEANVFGKITTGVNMAISTLSTGRLSRLKTLLDTVTTANSTVQTIDLTSSSTEAVSLLQGYILNVAKAAGSGTRIHMLWGAQAVINYGNHAKVQSRITGGATRKEPASLTLEQIDGLLLQGTVSRQTRTVVNTANVGETAVNDFLVGNSVYIAAVSLTPNEYDPGAVKLFQNLQGDSGLLSPAFGSPHGNNLVEQATFSWKENFETPNPLALYKINFAP